jgi:putative ABC transport system substrate-binding protein
MRRIGALLTGDASHPALAALREDLATRGHVEGRDVVIEARFDGGRHDRLATLAAELVALRPDAIAAIGAVQARAVLQATTSIPVVFAVIVDPVAVGLVPDLVWPGGNATGVTTFDPAQAAAQIRLLCELLPGLRRLAILGDAGAPDALPRANRIAAEAAGLRTLVLLPRLAEELDPAFATMREAETEALLALPLPLVSSNTARIVELTRATRLPALFGRDAARFGPLLAYGTSLEEAAGRLGAMLDRVLRGTAPGELPVETLVRPTLAVNLRMGRDIGITIPASLIARAAQPIG